MPTYKLTYFNLRARAEVSRFLFAVAGVEYEDCRCERGEWPTRKGETPFGQLPLLEVDGKVICQSHSIERYLAKKFGLCGSNDWEVAVVDMVIECLEDFRRKMIAVLKENDETKKKELKEKFLNDEGPKGLDNFEKILKQNNNSSNGHFVGNGLTVADISFFHMATSTHVMLGEEFPATWDRWPGLKGVRDTTSSHPKIQEWIGKRPDTHF